ncbi:MAG: hypothetical protein ABSA27_19340 [Terriglobales bacterium]
MPIATWAVNTFGPKRSEGAPFDTRLASNRPMTFRQSTLRLMRKTGLATTAIAALVACGDPK